MSLSPARAIGLSGLTLQSRRLAASANNVANASTDEYRAMRIEPVAQVQGGVDGRLAFTPDPGPVALDAEGTLERLSNTNLAAERVVQVQATRAFEANLKVLETADEMDRALLDVKG